VLPLDAVNQMKTRDGGGIPRPYGLGASDEEQSFFSILFNGAAIFAA